MGAIIGLRKPSTPERQLLDSDGWDLAASPRRSLADWALCLIHEIWGRKEMPKGLRIY